MSGHLQDFKLVLHQIEIYFVAFQLIFVDNFHCANEFALSVLGFINFTECAFSQEILKRVVLLYFFDLFETFEVIKSYIRANFVQVSNICESDSLSCSIFSLIFRCTLGIR